MTNEINFVHTPKRSRGGYKKLKRLRYGTQRLLKALWEEQGGVGAAARTLGFSPQNLINWRNQGKVPLKYIGKIGTKLSVPVEALNYEGVCVVHKETLPWKDVVNSCHLSEPLVEWVLWGTPPPPYREK